MGFIRNRRRSVITRYIRNFTDFVFAAIAEESGLIDEVLSFVGLSQLTLENTDNLAFLKTCPRQTPMMKCLKRANKPI